MSVRRSKLTATNSFQGARPKLSEPEPEPEPEEKSPRHVAVHLTCQTETDNAKMPEMAEEEGRGNFGVWGRGRQSANRGPSRSSLVWTQQTGENSLAETV